MLLLVALGSKLVLNQKERRDEGEVLAGNGAWQLEEQASHPADTKRCFYPRHLILIYFSPSLWAYFYFIMNK